MTSFQFHTWSTSLQHVHLQSFFGTHDCPAFGQFGLNVNLPKPLQMPSNRRVGSSNRFRRTRHCRTGVRSGRFFTYRLLLLKVRELTVPFRFRERPFCRTTLPQSNTRRRMNEWMNELKKCNRSTQTLLCHNNPRTHLGPRCICINWTSELLHWH